MSRPCREIEPWLGHPAAALSEGQKLALEQHLAGCAQCRALQQMSRSVRELVCTAPSQLMTSMRERAINDAFERVVRTRPPARSPWAVPGAGALAVAAAVLLWFVIGRAPTSAPVGWLEDDGAYAFAHAQVTLQEHGRVRFDAAHDTLELASGALEVEVDPRPHRPFAVQTARFRVEVLGTQFHVDARTVAVRHGHVRVLERKGGRVLADLRAGQRYDHAAIVRPSAEARASTAAARTPEPTPTLAPEPTRTPEPPAAPKAVEPRAREREPVARTPHPVAKTPHPVQPNDPSTLLADARAALGRDDLSATHRLLAAAEPMAHARAQRAELGTLQAELALRERDPAAATRAYLAVADGYPELPSGENALFAAAQLSLRSSVAASGSARAEALANARALLARYLARYPRGRFADEARARLASP